MKELTILVWKTASKSMHRPTCSCPLISILFALFPFSKPQLFLRLVVYSKFCSYLSEEWKERNPDADAGGYFDETHFITAKVPQQDNSYDCGIFLLHYVELFLKVAHTRFSLKRIRNLEPNFVSMETILCQSLQQHKHITKG